MKRCWLGGLLATAVLVGAPLEAWAQDRGGLKGAPTAPEATGGRRARTATTPQPPRGWAATSKAEAKQDDDNAPMELQIGVDLVSVPGVNSEDLKGFFNGPEVVFAVVPDQ